MRNILLVFMLALPIFAAAQQPAVPQDSNWQHVQALPPGASIDVKARASHKSCKLKSVDADTLICTHGQDLIFRRSDIFSVRIPRRGRSTLIAAGIGAGVGALTGTIAYGPGCTAAQRNSFLGCFEIFSRGDLAIIGGVAGAVIGTPIGYFTGFAKSTIYKAP